MYIHDLVTKTVTGLYFINWCPKWTNRPYKHAKSMPVRDHNRADTDPASAPLWLSSGMSAKYIKLRFPNKTKNPTYRFNFYNEKNLQ